MSGLLPPLNALRAFEAAARHQSLSAAAQELHVTPAAVSQQVKVLEVFLGQKLFSRRSRGLALSEDAARALPTLQRGFALLQEASRQLQPASHTDVIDLWAAPALATKWLMPRLRLFNELHPAVDLNIHASDAMVERRPGDHDAVHEIHRRRVDVAIVFGGGHYPGCRADKLLAVRAVPLCAPSLRGGDPPLSGADDLRFHHLLHEDAVYGGHHGWRDWLRETGMEGVDWRRGTHFNQVPLALEAAIAGQGVLLSLDIMAQRDIAAGRLCVPFGPALDLAPCYYVVRPLHRAHGAADRFCDWLLDQAQLSRAADAAAPLSAPSPGG